MVTALPSWAAIISISGDRCGKSSKRHILYLSIYCCLRGAIKGRKETLCYFSRQCALFSLSLFLKSSTFEAAVFSLAWLAMKQVEKVWGVFSKSQLVRGHVCTVSKMCLLPDLCDCLIGNCFERDWGNAQFTVIAPGSAYAGFPPFLPESTLCSGNPRVQVQILLSSFLKIFSGFSVHFIINPSIIIVLWGPAKHCSYSQQNLCRCLTWGVPFSDEFLLIYNTDGSSVTELNV